MPWRIPLPGRDLVGSFDGVHQQGLLQFRPGAANGRVILDFGLDWLAWSALGETRPVLRLLPGQPRWEIPPLAPEAARARLADLVAMAGEAARQALPFMPRSGSAWHVVATGDKPEGAAAAARKFWSGNNGYAGEGDDAWVRLALRGQDPFLDDDGGALMNFDQYSARVFHGLPAEGAQADRHD